jgi:hypothetical protein
MWTMVDRLGSNGGSADEFRRARADLAAILERIASLASEWGGTPDALRRAAGRLHRELGYTWLNCGRDTIEVRTAPGSTEYVCSRQTRTPDPAWRIVVGDDARRLLHFESMRRYVLPGPARSTAPVERLPWHILPPGEHPFPAILEYLRALSQRNPTVEYDHTRVENSLGPMSIYIGVEEFDGYFVFCFQQYSGAVLDCPRVGNAVYLMRESEWKTLCRLTKAELLARHHGGVRRIVHSHRWFERLKACLIPLSKSQPR